MKIYCIIDRKAKQVVSIFQALNDEAAQRAFLMVLTSPQSNIFTDFPEDFDVYPVADLSYSAGILTVTDIHCTDINAAGFNVKSYSVVEPISQGVDFDKRYLAVLRSDRSQILSQEDSNDDDKE